MSDDSHSELPSEFEELGIELEDTFSPSRQVTSFEIEQSDESDPEQRASRESETAAGFETAQESEDQQDNTSSTSSESMSAAVDVATNFNKTIFDLADALSDEDIRKNKIVVSKDKRGDKGSREYGTHYRLATEKLSRYLDAPAQFVPIVTKEDDDTARTKYKDIQSMYVGNMEILEELYERAQRYDLTDVHCVPDYRDKNAAHPSAKWAGSDRRTNIIENWSKLSVDQVADYQYDINKYSTEDGVSSEWLHDLVYNSSTPELRQLVAQKTSLLLNDDLKRGGAVMLKITLDVMFCMTSDVVSALQDFLENFGKDGIAKIPGENVPSAVKKILVVSTRLAEVNELPSKAVKWVLTGFSLCSVSEFKEPFKLLLNQEAISDMGKPVGSSENLSKDTLIRIKEYCTKASTTFESLSLSDKWVAPHVRTLSCWNCGSDSHGLNGCKEPKNQSKIDANIKDWEKKTGKTYTPRSSGGNGGRGRGGGYERSKFGGGSGRGDGGRGRGNGPGHHGVAKIGGEWLCHCSKRGADGEPCGWNRTHTTSYHGRWMEDPSSFPNAMPRAHPFHRMKGTSNGGGVPKTPSNPSNGGAGGGMDPKVSAVIKQSTAIFESLSKSTPDANMAADFEKLGALWGSLK